MKRQFDSSKTNPALECAVQMPSLRHQIPDEPFDIMKSEVAQWLCEQPEIRQRIFNWCKDKGAIVFDVETRTWRGIAS